LPKLGGRLGHVLKSLQTELGLEIPNRFEIWASEFRRRPPQNLGIRGPNSPPRSYSKPEDKCWGTIRKSIAATRAFLTFSLLQFLVCTTETAQGYLSSRGLAPGFFRRQDGLVQVEPLHDAQPELPMACCTGA
jgi:hypothetical protein